MAVFGTAGLLFRLGTRFLQEASDTKNLELEMRAIGPFLATLNNSDDADGAKIAFLDRRFGKLSTDVGTSGKNGEVSDSAVYALEIISKLLERIKASS
ncbi:hypothetical protein GCM10009715_39800 [Paeniglutamicibacter psychrophenolicus]